jgi:hypothetical protein
MNPDIRTQYFNRASPLKLAKQYFQYGFWKTRLMFKLREMSRQNRAAATTSGGEKRNIGADTPHTHPQHQAPRTKNQEPRTKPVGRLHWRHLVPPVFVIGIVASLLAVGYQMTVESTWLGWAVGLAVPLVYAFACIMASAIVVSRNAAWKYLPLLLVIFPILHLSWGTGFLAGLLRKPNPANFGGWPTEHAE